MDRHWLKSYPEGVPHDIHPEQFTSLNQLLEESFKTHADKPFSVCMDRWMSYRELDQLSAALGAWLQQLGLERRLHLRDFVEHQGAGVGLLELADARVGRAGEGAALVPEEFALQ